jgi:biopolymer transport protein TolR
MTSLLAIFMITAPLLTSGIPLDLPNGDGKTLPGEERTLDLSVNQSGDVFIGSVKVEQADILPKISAIVKENPSIRMIISADKNTSYGNVISLMGMLRAAGYSQVGLKTDGNVMQSKVKGKK